MKKRRLLYLVLISFPFAATAQQMDLQSGVMTVNEGTRVTVNGPVQWNLAPGAVLVNDGTIDLGEEATLSEQLGEPVTGSGTEQAIWTAPAPFASAEPGGLGLSFSASSGPSPLTVVRGHEPITLPLGDESVARWYLIESDPFPEGSLDVEFSYDPTEVNGLSPTNLSLFRADLLTGPWMALASSAGSNTVSASYPAPWAYLSAFDMDASTGVPSLVVRDGFQVFPTIVEQELHIVADQGSTIETIEWLDGLGRAVPFQQTLRGVDHATLVPNSLSSGAYFLRVNGTRVFKLRVP